MNGKLSLTLTKHDKGRKKGNRWKCQKIFSDIVQHRRCYTFSYTTLRPQTWFMVRALPRGVRFVCCLLERRYWCPPDFLTLFEELAQFSKNALKYLWFHKKTTPRIFADFSVRVPKARRTQVVTWWHLYISWGVIPSWSVRMISVHRDNSELLFLGFFEALLGFCPRKNKNVKHEIQF